jgi:hypothetical protein
VTLFLSVRTRHKDRPLRGAWSRACRSYFVMIDTARSTRSITISTSSATNQTSVALFDNQINNITTKTFHYYIFLSSIITMNVSANILLLLFATSWAGAASSNSNHHAEDAVLTDGRNHPNHLRRTKEFQPSVCNDIKNENQCFATKDEATEKSCVWCDCQAVPSVCVTVSSLLVWLC